MKDKVYVRWNPLHETVVCVHSSEDNDCNLCIEERKKLEGTPYFLQGKWLSVDSGIKLCYCGSEVDLSNPDCVEFDLCKEHSIDV